MLMFKNEFCKIYYYKDLSLVHLSWSDKMATHEGFKEACEFSLTLMESKKVYKMIADNSKVPVVTRENQLWLTDDWFPRAIEKGFRFSAVVVPDNEFIMYTVKKIENRINNKLFTVQYFTTVDSAKAWLNTV